MIDSYKFGQMVVDGKTFRSDLIILPDRVVTDWWRRKGHLLQLVDLEPYFHDFPSILVVGTGQFGLMKLDRGLEESLCARGIVLYAYATSAACSSFNNLITKGGPVAGAFHLTC